MTKPTKEPTTEAKGTKPRKSFPRRLLGWLLWGLWVVIITAVLLEGLVRWRGYSEHYLYDPIYQPCAESDEIPFVHKPNLTGARGRGLTDVYTDGLGLRCSADDEQPTTKPAGEIRVAGLGDSVTFGEGVKNNDDTFCRVLQNQLNAEAGAGRRYRVQNFGVSAYSVKDMYHTLVHRVAAVQPDIVLLAIVPEDFDLTRTPQVDAYGYTYNAQMSGYLAKDSRLKRFLRNVHSAYWLRDMLYHWRHRNDTPADSNELPASYSYIKKFHEFARKQGWRNAVVLLPSQASSFRQALRKQLSEDGVTVINLTKLSETFSAEDFQASPFDRHPSAKVHRAIGEAMAKELREP